MLQYNIKILNVSEGILWYMLVLTFCPSVYELLFVKTRQPQLRLHTLRSVPRDEQMDIDDDLEDCLWEFLKVLPWHFPGYTRY
jgi:hypothetical protein